MALARVNFVTHKGEKKVPKSKSVVALCVFVELLIIYTSGKSLYNARK